MGIRCMELVVVAVVVAGGAIACAPAPIPSPTPSPRPLPTATVEVPTGLLPTPPGNRMAPNDVPACSDAKHSQPVQFEWVGMGDVIRDAPETNWTYYHCAQSKAELAAFYRQWMRKAPYIWIEAHWEEQPGATQGIYYHQEPDRWLYLWFLPEKSDPQTSNLVAAWWDKPHSC
jgi:hypothetical protein